MKYLFIPFQLLLVLFTILLISCDDSGTIPSPSGTTRVTFSPRLKQLDKNIDGTYELWLEINVDTGYIFCSYGKFNLDGQGNTLDLNGNPMTLQFPVQCSSYVSKMTKSWLTIEPPGDNDTVPSNAVLLAGDFTNYYDTISARLTINHRDALGTVGDVLLTGIRGRYMHHVKTADSTDCRRTIWFCDPQGTPYFAEGLDLTSNPGWTWQGWVVDKTTDSAYSIGRFANPYIADDDGPGPCAGPLPGYNAPGQEWINCGPITNIMNGNYELWVTIEPKSETIGSEAWKKPFFFYPYFNDPIGQIQCGYENALFNIFNYPNMEYPKVYIRISKGRVVSD